MSGNKPDYLNGRYVYKQMHEGFQAFENEAGYKLYGLHTGSRSSDMIGGRSVYEDPPHYWLISQSWHAEYGDADEVFWVEKNMRTWSKGDGENDPEFELCCAFATEGNCTNKYNMHDYEGWAALKTEPSVASCIDEDAENCPAATEYEDDLPIALIIMALVLVVAIAAIITTVVICCCCMGKKQHQPAFATTQVTVVGSPQQQSIAATNQGPFVGSPPGQAMPAVVVGVVVDQKEPAR